MNSSQIIALVASAAALAIPLIFQEAIKEAIKKSFSDLSPQQVRRYFVLGLLLCFVIVSGTGFTISAASTPAAEENYTSQETIDTYQNDTIQAAVELTKTVIETGKEFVDNKRTRDSITLTNRDKYWVYVIGTPKEDESAAWDAAMQIASIGNISIFKGGRKNYSVICDPGYNEQTLQDSLNSYLARLSALGLTSRIELVDLMSTCSKKESLIETDPVKRKKHEESFKCLTCDK